ncbi:MAG TPA: hypothetical protein VGL48_05045 [Acidimicrobiales bacterium]
MEDLVPFVRFCGDQHGNAEEAVTWYCSPFPDSRLLRLDRDGPAEREPEETVRSASFELGEADDGHRQHRSPQLHLHAGDLDVSRMLDVG